MDYHVSLWQIMQLTMIIVSVGNVENCHTLL
jgi:hypothetical protein